jgi:imidazolonepropionase
VKRTLLSKKPIFFANIDQLVTMRSLSGDPGPRRGPELSELGIIQSGAILCLGGKIVSIGQTKDALRDPWIKKNRKRLLEIDCAGKVVLPGFVDSHTHPAFISPRLIDFERRISGATYEQIAEAGGGIRSSVDAVRGASKAQLAAQVGQALREIASFGTTTVEAKTGYGLSLESELKSLEAIKQAVQGWPGTVMATLLAAHVVPREFSDRRAEYVNIIHQEMIPAVAKRKLASFVDVFCDRGAFTEDETLAIASAARVNGLDMRLHISQLARTGLERILEAKPASLDHLDFVNDADIKLLAENDTVATLVPGTNYFLGLKQYPPARKLIDSGAAVALATDFNPGSSPTPSMPFVISLACTHMKMTPAEAITAATINGAAALGLADRKGSIEPGKDADLAVFDVGDYREIAYWVAVNRCWCTVLNGDLQFHRTNEISV